LDEHSCRLRKPTTDANERLAVRPAMPGNGFTIGSPGELADAALALGHRLLQAAAGSATRLPLPRRPQARRRRHYPPLVSSSQGKPRRHPRFPRASSAGPCAPSGGASPAAHASTAVRTAALATAAAYRRRTGTATLSEASRAPGPPTRRGAVTRRAS